MTSLSDAELLARLVGFDSTSHRSNLPIADFLCDYLDQPGVHVVRHLSAEGDKANVLAWVGPREVEGRAGLVLSGHMDVVPALEEGWESDPFSLSEREDRYVARGACDMKGFLALAANLAREHAGRTLRAPLALVFTYDEEVGTLGARHLVATCEEARHLPRGAVIGEPTSLTVARAHKGHLKLRITLRGASAHSAYPHLGRNAIEPAGEVIRALTRLRRELEAEARTADPLFPEVPFVTLNVGTVHGGSAINVVPDRCVVEAGLRPLPGQPSRVLAERCREAVQAELAAMGTLPPMGTTGATPSPLAPVPAVSFEVLSDSPALLLPEAAPIHRYLCGLVGQRSDAAVSFATDAGWLQQLGLDCVIFGPGSISVAHRPNEHLPKAELHVARGLLASTIQRFCVARQDGVEHAESAEGGPA